MTGDLQAFLERLDQLYAAGDTAKVEEYLLASANSFRPCCSGFSENYVAVLNELGSFYRGTSRYAQSRDAFERALQLVGQFAGNRTADYATILCNLAGTCRLAGQLEEAASLFGRSIALLEELGLTGSFAYASALNNLSLVLHQQGDPAQAVPLALRALEVMGDRPEFISAVATTHSNLAAFYHAMGQTEAAETALGKALALFEQLPPGEVSHHYAALNNLAAFCYGRGEYQQARELYQKVLALVGRAWGQNAEYQAASRALERCIRHLEGQP